MEKKKWKVAVIGCGNFGRGVYIPNVSKEANAECVAVVDIVFERAKEMQEKYNIPYAFRSVTELIEKCDFDIAIDSASIQAHHEINMAVLKAGKHLISQKPAAPTVEMLTEQMELAKKMGVKYACAPIHPMRHDLAVAKQIMADGGIGEPVYIKCNMTHGGPEYFQYRPVNPQWFFEEGAGALVDMGVHGLQTVTTMFGPIKKVSCLATITDPNRTVRSGAYNGVKIKTDILPDQYLISITFKNGKIGFVDTGFSQKASKCPTLEIYGTRGTISVTQPYMENKKPEVYIDSHAVGLRGWTVPLDWEEKMPTIKSQCCILADLIKAIETDGTPVLSAEHARHVLEVMCKIPEAIASGSTVDIETEF